MGIFDKSNFIVNTGSEEDWSERRRCIRKDTGRGKLQHGAEWQGYRVS